MCSANLILEHDLTPPSMSRIAFHYEIWMNREIEAILVDILWERDRFCPRFYIAVLESKPHLRINQLPQNCLPSFDQKY